MCVHYTFMCVHILVYTSADVDVAGTQKRVSYEEEAAAAAKKGIAKAPLLNISRAFCIYFYYTHGGGKRESKASFLHYYLNSFFIIIKYV